MHYCLVAFPETSNSLSDWPYSASPIGYSINATLQCGSISSCPTCLHTTFNCVWCGHNCQYAKCTEGLTHTKAITSLEHCQVAVANTCRLLHRQVRLFRVETVGIFYIANSLFQLFSLPYGTALPLGA